jgi:hypothetical protein
MEKETKIKIRDLRKKEHFIVDDAYLNGWARKCGIYATGVYVVLCRHADFTTQVCFPSMQLIAEKLAISRKQVQRSIAILEKFQIISKCLRNKKNGGYINEYLLLDKSVWREGTTIETNRPSGNVRSIETLNPDHRGRESHCTGTNSLKKDSHIKDSHEGLSQERLLSEVQRIFPSARLPKKLSTRNLDYFLQLYEAGKICKGKIENPTAYIKSLLMVDDYIPYQERERSREEQAHAQRKKAQREMEMRESLNTERGIPEESRRYIDQLFGRR